MPRARTSTRLATQHILVYTLPHSPNYLARTSCRTRCCPRRRPRTATVGEPGGQFPCSGNPTRKQRQLTYLRKPIPIHPPIHRRTQHPNSLDRPIPSHHTAPLCSPFSLRPQQHIYPPSPRNKPDNFAFRSLHTNPRVSAAQRIDRPTPGLSKAFNLKP
jgi:hypothetical protein